MTIINGVLRLLPGTVGTSLSLVEESHNNFLLEHPHYTRPQEFRGMRVPEVLRSGDHSAISNWRKVQSELRTKERRPDLYEQWLLKRSSSNLEIDSSYSKQLWLEISKGYELQYPDW